MEKSISLYFVMAPLRNRSSQDSVKVWYSRTEQFIEGVGARLG